MIAKDAKAATAAVTDAFMSDERFVSTEVVTVELVIIENEVVDLLTEG